MAAQILDYDGTFFRGAKSDMDPSQIPVGYYFGGFNVINQGGMLGCRPGYDCVIEFPEGNLQGGGFFRPKVGLEQVVVAVDGKIYVAEFPFTDFRQLSELQFSPSAKQLFFEMTEQSAKRRTADQASAIDIIAPKAVMMIQDGGETAPGYYDGAEAGHIRDNPFETPSGGMMKWVGDRLWVATGGYVRASDIANPFSFREELYLGGTTALSFTGDVTALGIAPGLENPQLIVFTESNASLVKSYLRDRASWETEPNFQTIVFDVGCSSSRSVVSHMGQLMWYAAGGVVFFDAAIISKQTGRLPFRDSEMAQSKAQIRDDTSLVAGGSFGNYLMMSVPSEDTYNKHTWVLNNASLETISDSSGPSWCGLWTGTRPVQWLCGVVAGTERAYFLSKDEDGGNRLWRAFSSQRLDNGCPITWAGEMRGYFGPSGQSGKPPGAKCRFRYAKLRFSGIFETLNVGVFFAGGSRGAYKQILNQTVVAQRGSLQAGSTVTAMDKMFGFKAQARELITQDVGDMPLENSETCPVESQDSENIDESFQLLIVGHGPGTLRAIRVFCDPEIDSVTGSPEACEAETEFNAVRFDGAGAQGEGLPEVLVKLSALADYFTSNKTVGMTYKGISAVGVGYATSIVSQEAADRVATRIATRTAENEIMGLIPPTLGSGETEE